MSKYGDLACPVCGTHDTKIDRVETDAQGAQLHVVCSPAGHKWTVREAALHRAD